MSVDFKEFCDVLKSNKEEIELRLNASVILVPYPDVGRIRLEASHHEFRFNYVHNIEPKYFHIPKENKMEDIVQVFIDELVYDFFAKLKER